MLDIILRAKNNVILLLLILVTLWSVQLRAESSVEFCEPYSYVAQVPVNIDKPFLQYHLSVEATPNNRKKITVIADHLIVDQQTLGSLVRAASAVDDAIEEITLDAQTVDFVDTINSITLSQGSINIIARHINFMDGSTITLLPSSNSTISLYAEKINLSPSGYRHFDLRESKSIQGDIDTVARSHPLLKLRATSVNIGQDQILPKNLTAVLASRFSRFPITNFENSIDAKVGSSGKEGWENILKERAQWPSHSINVLKAAFMVAPFDQKTTQQIKARLEIINPILIAMKDGGLIIEASSMANSIASGIDLDGNGPAYVPNRPLSDILREISEYTTDNGKLNSLKFAIDLIEKSIDLTPADPATLNSAVAALNEKIRISRIAFQSTNHDLIRVQTNLTALASLLNQQTSAYKIREKRLREHAEDIQRAARDHAQVVSLLSTAASIATTAYTGSPQTGSAVGGVLYLVGDSMAGKSAIDSLGAGIQFTSAIQKPLEGLTGVIDEFKKSRSTYDQFIESFKVNNITIKKEIIIDNPSTKEGEPKNIKLSRDEALGNLSRQASKLSSGINDLLKVYREFQPKEDEASIEVEEDESLIALGKDLAQTLEQVKRLTQDLEALQRAAQEQEIHLAKSTELVAQLTNLPISNELRRKLFGNLAITIAREELAKFTVLADMLRRVSIVEFRAPLPVDPDLIQNAIVVENLDDNFNPTRVLDRVVVGRQYKDLLEQRKNYIRLLALTLVSAADRQFREYVENQGRAPYISYPTEEFIDKSKAQQDEYRFMAQLNSLLEEQYRARHNPERLAELQKRQLLIPFNMRQKVDERFPARLLQIAITDIKHTGKLSGGDIVFRIEVERVGNLRKMVPSYSNVAGSIQQYHVGSDMQCFSVDLRPKTTSREALYIPSEFTVAQVKSGGLVSRTSAQSFWYLKESDSPPTTGRTMMVTYSPAEARMYLKVRIDPNTTWKKQPHIEKLTITAEIFQ